MKKKQITWIIAATLTLAGTLFLHTWLVDSSSWKGMLGLLIGCVLLYPSVKGWAELIEPTVRHDEEEA
jgi:hypothetical protein